MIEYCLKLSSISEYRDVDLDFATLFKPDRSKVVRMKAVMEEPWFSPPKSANISMLLAALQT